MRKKNCFIVNAKSLKNVDVEKIIDDIYAEYDIITHDNNIINDIDEIVYRSDRQFSITIVFSDSIEYFMHVMKKLRYSMYEITSIINDTYKLRYDTYIDDKIISAYVVIEQN